MLKAHIRNSMECLMKATAFRLVVILVAAGPLALVAQSPRDDPGLRRLENEIAHVSTLSGGRVGVGVVHLESGRELFVNGAERFPMASTYKVPIAVALLTRVDSGKLRLDSMITLQPSDLHPGSGTI